MIANDRRINWFRLSAISIHVIFLHYSLAYRNIPIPSQPFHPVVVRVAPIPISSKTQSPPNVGNVGTNRIVVNPPSIPPPPSSPTFATSEFFDLSYTYDNNTLFYPGQRFSKFHLFKDVQSNNRTSTGYPYFFSQFSMCLAEHGGTHIDAPFHFNRYGWRVAEIPIDRLADIPTAIIDVEPDVFALKNPEKFVLETDHILQHESRFGQIPQGALVLVRFGWGRFYPDWSRYLGWDNSTAGRGGPEFTLSFPGVSLNAASWLLRERRIVGLGSDTMSPDVDTVNLFVHILLLENQVYIIENVANLDTLVQRTRHQNKSCNLRSFVMPIKSMGTGGPVRLFSYCRN